MHALDARTGERLWSYDPGVAKEKAKHTCCDVVNRGVAVWDGQVFLGALDGRLIALDASTGTVNWEVATIDPALPYTITGAPRVVKGKVLIGNGGAEFGVRGFIAAYDVTTGERLWQFFTVPGKPRTGLRERSNGASRRDLERQVVGARGRRRNGLGRDGLRPGARPLVLRRRQRHAVEPGNPIARRR